jgi:hypothetical protein
MLLRADKVLAEQKAKERLDQELDAILAKSEDSSSFAETLGRLGKAVEWSENGGLVR